jgi:hypothetical protein
MTFVVRKDKKGKKASIYDRCSVFKTEKEALAYVSDYHSTFQEMEFVLFDLTTVKPRTLKRKVVVE